MIYVSEQDNNFGATPERKVIIILVSFATHDAEGAANNEHSTPMDAFAAK